MKAIITYRDKQGNKDTKEVDFPLKPIYAGNFMTKIAGIYSDVIISIDVKFEPRELLDEFNKEMNKIWGIIK